MKEQRLEVRLDEEHARKIAELREAYGTTASDTVRRAIASAHAEWIEQARTEALERILASEGVDDVPEDMETLKRQLGRHRDQLPQ
jgi:Arc/MetJ-type ribon-helix-helix transcriptional regulator